MKPATAVPKAHLPPIPLDIPVTKVKYKGLIADLVRIYQTHACSLSEGEQLAFCRMVEGDEYEHGQSADHSIACHKAYRKMFHPLTHAASKTP